MSYNWGPHYIVPTPSLREYSGNVRLREELNEDLLAKELNDLGFSGSSIERITNPWYFRKKGTSTWIKIGESDNKEENFPVLWETASLENGQYEILGLMHVSIKKGNKTYSIARENVAEVTVAN